MEKIIEYLSALKENNNREWYHAHKKEYQMANEEFLYLIQDLIIEIGKTDAGVLHNIPKDLTFKLVRDTRFSHDKSPYKPCLRAHISSKGKLPIPVGYFISIKPDNGSFLGGGLFADMFKDATTMIRDYIVENGQEWERIVSDAAFRRYFEIKGTTLKNVPREYDREHPQADYLKYKSWYIEYPVTNEQLVQEDFIKNATEVFVAMQPFNNYLNKALVGFEMPKRVHI